MSTKFVLHEHWSRTHHFDFRLEKDKVLKSWALPKGMPTGKEKRLAIQVGDHALSYGDFEGKIPEGQYGAGKVEIADSGTYTTESWKPRKVVFSLKGKKYSGKYVLLHLEKDKWLLFKGKEK